MLASACGGSSKGSPKLEASAGASHAGAQTTSGGSAATEGMSPNHGGAGGAVTSGGGGGDQAGGGRLVGDVPDVSGGTGGTDGDAGATSDGGALGDGGNTNAAGAFNGGAGNGGDGGAGHDELEIECSCASDEACIRVTVRREADDSHMPWTIWPNQTDGVGNLRVSAVSDRYTIQDKTMVSNANFVSPDAAYGAPLCVPAGSTHVRAFLDDNEDEDPNAVTSSDYLDSCASGSAQCFRCFDLNVSAGATADLTIYLAHTCD